MPRKFPNIKQTDLKNCGPTCLQIIAKFYNKHIPLEHIQKLAGTNRIGTTLLGLSEAAESLGFRTLAASIDFTTLKNDGLFPCIVHWNNSHFIVVYKITAKYVYVSDPGFGLLKYKYKDFIDRWISDSADESKGEGIVLFMEKTPFFEDSTSVHESKKKDEYMNLSKVIKYLIPYKKWIIQLVIGLLAGSIITLIFPFLTQFLVDYGIKDNNISIIYLILLAQLMLFLGNAGIEIIRSWLILHLNTRVRISIITDFFIKLMSLPISFFDSRLTGDILQRIQDHRHVENLLTTGTLNSLFSFISLIVFSIVIFTYDTTIFGIFLVGSILYISWILIFLKRRRELNYKNFSRLSLENSTLIELISGMPEIKTNNAETAKRWSWENVQIKLFKINVSKLKIEQIQSVGARFINQLKDIIITFISAKLVLNNEISLGMMLSLQYIIGQLNNPLIQLVGFIQEFQDAKISLERLNELYSLESEKEGDMDLQNSESIIGDIVIKDLNFKYPGSMTYTLKNINVVVPKNRKTAIVGASGSGKTTLMKILMKYYDSYEGNININDLNFNNISPKYWRGKCGIVMQDPFIFNDTITNNIALTNDKIDFEKLIKASEISNSLEFINELPQKFNTLIGDKGVGLSGGQKQRLMIARSIYKDPDFLFLDEATSSLDSNNEKDIIENLNEYLKGKTSIVIAHRLSTVKDADLIVVMDQGEIIEQGTHKDLSSQKGKYYHLIKNQLELDLINEWEN